MKPVWGERVKAPALWDPASPLGAVPGGDVHKGLCVAVVYVIVCALQRHL